jgi:hypothetical protein
LAALADIFPRTQNTIDFGQTGNLSRGTFEGSDKLPAHDTEHFSRGVAGGSRDGVAFLLFAMGNIKFLGEKVNDIHRCRKAGSDTTFPRRTDPRTVNP